MLNSLCWLGLEKSRERGTSWAMFGWDCCLHQCIIQSLDVSEPCKVSASTYFLVNKEKSGAWAVRAPTGFTCVHLFSKSLVSEEGCQLH